MQFRLLPPKRGENGVFDWAMRIRAAIPGSDMFRSFPTPGALAASVVVVLALIGALIAAAYWGGPKLLERRLVREAAARDLALSMTELDLGWKGIELRGIELRDNRSGAEAKIDSLRVDANLWALYRRRHEAIERIRLEGARGQLDVGRLIHTRIQRRGHREDQADESKGARGRAIPPLRIERVDLDITYDDEPFIEVRDFGAEVEESAFRTVFASIEMPLSRSEGRIQLEGIELDGRLEASAIDRVQIARCDLSELTAAEQSARLLHIARELETRLRSPEIGRGDAQRAGGAEDESGGPSAEAPEHHAEEGAWDAKGNGGSSEIQRREEAEDPSRRDTDHADEDASDEAELHQSAGSGSSRPEHAKERRRARWAPLGERLGEGFSMEIRETILPAVGGFSSFRLSDLRMVRQSGRGLRIRGQGRDDEGARADFDLTVSLSELRADGSLDVEKLRLGSLAAFLPWIPFHEPEKGLLDITLILKADSLDEIVYEADLDLHHVGFYSPRIAADPIVDMAFGVTASGRFHRQGRALEIESAELRLEKAKLLLEGELRIGPESVGVDLKANLPRTPCEDAVHALPKAVLGSASAFHFRGMISGEFALRFDWEALDDLDLKLRFRHECRFVDWPRHADPSRFMRIFVHEALSPDGEPFDFETGPMTEVWSPLEALSPYLIPAFLAHEDAGFFRHPGFSVFAIRESLIRNLSRGRFERGASTISMQLAKNLFLNREKVLVRKLREVIYTWWLESAFGKEQILELYVNVVELGPYLYGVRSASLHYFGREPAELSPAEAAFLAISLPAPRRAGEQYEKGALSRSSRSRIANLLRNMKRRNLISEEAADYGIEELDGFRFYRRGDPLPPERHLPETPALFDFQRSGAIESNPTEGEDPRDGTLPVVEVADPWGFP